MKLTHEQKRVRAEKRERERAARATQPLPGPWKPRNYKTAEGHIWIDCDSWVNPKTASCRGGTIATVMATGVGDYSLKATAKLIAAAPTLLAACVEALTLRDKSYQVDANPKLDILARRKLAAEIQAIEGRIRAAIYTAGAGDPDDAICLQCGKWLFPMDERPGYRRCTNKDCKLKDAAVLS